MKTRAKFRSVLNVMAAASAAVSVWVAGCASGADELVTRNEARRAPTGRYIPVTRPSGEGGEGRVLETVAGGSLPVNMVMTADGKYVVSMGQGYSPRLVVLDVSTGREVSHLEIKWRRRDTRGFYYGMTIREDGTLFVSRGAHETVGIYRVTSDGKVEDTETSLQGRKGDFFAGVAVDGAGRVFVTSNYPSSPKADGASTRPLDQPGAVVAFDSGSKQEVGRVTFPSPLGTNNFVLAAAVTKDGKRLYVSSQRDGCVYVLDSSEASNMTILGKIDVGANPTCLVLDEKRGGEGGRGTLYCVNSDSDTVSIIDLAQGSIGAVEATVLLRPTTAKNLPCASPLNACLSPDGERLYVALGNLNCVAVVDVAEHEVEGMIPVGGYPSGVATDGKRLFSANAKGTTTRYPKSRPSRPSNYEYFKGDVTSLELPGRHELAGMTEVALRNARVTEADLNKGNPLAHVGVKHVIYVIKENRTYDQLFGDLPQGNGKAEYVMFGKDVTPNQRALAERFVLMDNFFDCGDVSGEGWPWSTQAMANEYIHRNVPYSYSQRGREYDYEGMNGGYVTGGFPAKGVDGETLSSSPAMKDGAPALKDVAYSPGGALWDLCKANGRTYRNYGMFLSEAGNQREAEGATTRSTAVNPDNYPATPGLQPPGHDLAGVSNIDFRRYDMSYPDSDGPENYFRATGDKRFLYEKRTYGKYASPSRMSEFRREFELMLRKDPSGGAVPEMMFLRLGNDHTAGARGGAHSPRGMVADNDYAVGQLVELVSHSPIWESTAIFVLEDDAQNGPDHVDAHRSICFVISPWVKRGTVEHAFHNTVSCIRTMELLLGLPPMNVNDASAEPMAFFDAAPANRESFKAILPDPNIMCEINPRRGQNAEYSRLIEESEKMDFDHADAAPAEQLNRIIWAMTKGMSTPMPETPNTHLGEDGVPDRD